ncbi:acetyl/propionyl/methylcrotonyl-CoA carboxylase subunit alpha [Alteromonas aestuariivivens]|uniref:Biotin carboxylase n=1 Tax=Alteromonas aestuariivivens TaxID=1938339 RepID=A0A3D8MAS0_9ALTE|nr:acetyl/propionyl/methylcrotonyl-CoA carboxylase subunit alpha [Alteromonas aestuariivivens]RDV27464.1 acetyl/propionyl/methylcrotonyl-CoA carboxylase subunit alpha [Alteromonas aestuariivivens]
MIDKLLIANRGEIACRIIRTARKIGIATVAVYSDADASALHVALADESIHIGSPPAKESYLAADKIIAAARKLGANAIHPGYGFLSENADFARLCENNQIIFVGPPAAAIEAMGSKSAAKKIMQKAGVPLIPGYHDNDQSDTALQKAAQEMGYPVLLKASSGGGGKGMRQVWRQEDFTAALEAARREALASFGDDAMLVEKYLTRPRHVEVQIFCDQHGQGVYLFERDCSVQRRHQKIIEEAPAPGLGAALRKQMGETALRAAQAIDYVGAGTVEFLLDEDGQFYFMEMNTRLQVEHPVTEKITGEDLVEWQLRVAEGAPLPKSQQQLTAKGHAFEARIYAEDPANGFLPSTGRLKMLQPPEEDTHTRVDTGVQEGDEVSVFYDPMIAKLVVWDENRDKALQRLLSALQQYYVDGVTTNIPFLYSVAASEPFRSARLVTTFIDLYQDQLLPGRPELAEDTLAIMALLEMLNRQRGSTINREDPHSPWSLQNAWRANEVHCQQLRLTAGNQEFELYITPSKGIEPAPGSWQVQYRQQVWQVSGSLEGHYIHAIINGHRSRVAWSGNEQGFVIFTAGHALRFAAVTPDLGDTEIAGANPSFQAPMNGTIVKLTAEPGEQVKAGATLMIMEAMKMEHCITAPVDGKVKQYFFAAGDLVDGGTTLLEYEPYEA